MDIRVSGTDGQLYCNCHPMMYGEKLDKELSSTPATKIRIFSFTAIAAIIILLLLSSVGIYLLTNYKPDKNIPQILSESLPTENHSYHSMTI